MKTIKTIALLCTLSLFLGACDNKKPAKTNNAPAGDAAVLTSEEKAALKSEFAEEAKKNITIENADKIAAELEKEITADK